MGPLKGLLQGIMATIILRNPHNSIGNYLGPYIGGLGSVVALTAMFWLKMYSYSLSPELVFY